MIDVEEIKRIADINAVLSFYNIIPNRAGFINCIVHHEKKPSMKVYPRTNSVHCFGCGADFDCIGFIMQIEKCSFIEACNQLKSMFRLSDNTKTQNEIKQKYQQILQEKQKQQQQKERQDKLYFYLCDRLHKLEDEYRKNVPKIITDEFRNNTELVEKSFDLVTKINTIEKFLSEII